MNVRPLPFMVAIALAATLPSPAADKPVTNDRESAGSESSSRRPPDRGRPPPSWDQGPGRVILYADRDYRGESIVIEEGAEIGNARNLPADRAAHWNDRVSSLRVEGRVRVTLYADGDFRGASLTVTRDVPDLSGFPLAGYRETHWDNVMSSLRVDGERRGPVPDNPARRDPEGVIDRAFHDLLRRKPSPAEVSTYRRRILDDNWDESLVREAIRQLPEYRNGAADVVISRAFREVLRREPDAAGLAAYRPRVLDQGWDERRIAGELRRSDEYRTTVVPAIITRAYRDLLGRDPDPSGRAEYERRMIHDGWSEERVRDTLRRSPEYRNRQRR